MRYQRFDDDELAELRRPREGAEAERDELLLRISGHAESERRRILDGKSSSKQDLLDAVSDAEYKLHRQVLRRWTRDGTIREWDASGQLFMRAKESCLTDLLRRKKHERPAKKENLGAESAASPPGRVLPPHSYENPQLNELAHLMIEFPSEARDPRLLFGLVAVRTIRALSERTVKPFLDGVEAHIVRFYQVGQLAVDDVAVADLRRASGGVEGGSWRDEAAEALGVPKTKVYATTRKVDGYLRMGYYLFLMLAPLRHPVVKTETMSELFDVAYAKGSGAKGGLEATSRMLLQKAGGSLEGTLGRWHVGESGFLKKARELNRMRNATDETIVSHLHDAETTYAMKVPGQVVPPRFRCVLSCDIHKPLRKG